MNILLITPGINKKFNDNYYVYKDIVDSKNNILAISNKENINKGGPSEKSVDKEYDGTLFIERVFSTIREQQSYVRRRRHSKYIKALIAKFEPDVIFCEEISNLSLCLDVKKDHGIPIVLRTEFAFDRTNPYRNMGRILSFFKNPVTKDILPQILGGLIWRWAYSNVDAVISCYFGDKYKEPVMYGKPFYYVPWPTYHSNIDINSGKKIARGIFVGSFDTHKNISEFLETIPKLLENTPLDQFYIVGTGKDLHVVKKLAALYPEAITHYSSLPREECLKLIRASCFTYSPATSGGWGFIGDSWAMGTPLIVTHNHYDFHDRIDSVVTSPENISERVNSLLRNSTEYEQVRLGGLRRYSENHSTQAIASKFLRICSNVLSNQIAS